MELSPVIWNIVLTAAVIILVRTFCTIVVRVHAPSHDTSFASPGVYLLRSQGTDTVAVAHTVACTSTRATEADRHGVVEACMTAHGCDQPITPTIAHTQMQLLQP